MTMIQREYDFLITDIKSKERYDRIKRSKEGLQSDYISLRRMRKYLFQNHLRGNVETKRIEQAYYQHNYELLHQLLQERFLQLFSKQEFGRFLSLFKFNKWSWQDVINEFDILESKCNAMQIVSGINRNN